FAVSYNVLRFQIAQRSDVRIGKIVHMNVVANAGAIRSWVVGAVNFQLGSVRGGGSQRQRNQVSFRVMDFANLAALVGSGSVEITQTHRAQSVSTAIRRKRVFEKQFRRPI